MNTRLGTTFPLFNTEKKMDACCRHSCSLECIFQPWGLLPYPWDDSAVDSYWELCPGILPDVTCLLVSSLENSFDFIWCFNCAPLCGWNPTCLFQGRTFVLWITPVLEAPAASLFPPAFPVSPGASQGLPLWSQQTLFKYVSLENGHSPFSYISFLKEEGEQNIFLWIHLGDQDPFQEAAPKFSCLHAGFLQTLPGRRVRIFFFSMCPPSKCEGFILGGVANMTPLKKQNPNRPRFGMLEWPREPRDELTQARSDYPLTSPCQAFCWLPASNTFVTDVRTLGLLHSHIQQMEIVVVVEPSNDIPLPFRTEFSSAQGPPPQPPWQSSSPGQVVTVSTSWHSFWSQAPFTYLPATLRGLITHAPSRSSLNTWVFCVQGWELECWLSFCGQSQSYKEGWKGRNYEVAFANCCSQFLLFQAVMRFPIRQLT